MSDIRQDLSTLLVVASVRDDRVGRAVADTVAPLVPDELGLTVVDLAGVELPEERLLEPGGGRPSETSHLVAAADAYLIVTPEYNHGYPASLKRFIDAHFAEWRHKAATIVPYGAVGGLVGGESLRGVLAECSVVTTRRMVGLPAPWDRVREGSVQLADGERAALADAFAELEWWARVLRDGRARYAG